MATPLICGENAGQHMYIDAGSYSTLSAKLKLLMTGSTARKWKIKVIRMHLNDVEIVILGFPS